MGFSLFILPLFGCRCSGSLVTSPGEGTQGTLHCLQPPMSCSRQLWHPQRQQFSPSTPWSHPESLITREPSALTPFLFRGNTRKDDVQPGRALPARTEASTSQRRRPLTAWLPAPPQPPKAAGQRGAPAAPDLGSSPLLSFWLVARSAAELAFSPSQARNTHMFFVFLTRFLKFTHFCTLELPSARVNHRIGSVLARKTNTAFWSADEPRSPPRKHMLCKAPQVFWVVSSWPTHFFMKLK